MLKEPSRKIKTTTQRRALKETMKNCLFENTHYRAGFGLLFPRLNLRSKGGYQTVEDASPTKRWVLRASPED